MLPIQHIPSDGAEIFEQMGTKYKFWYRGPLRERMLFKRGRDNTGENWAEVLAAEFARMLGIPHASYEFAYWQGHLGVRSPSFVPKLGTLIHGNELLGGTVTSASHDTQLKFYEQRDHTITAVLKVFQKNDPLIHIPRDQPVILNISTALDVFIGYLLFDTWISNQDRHSQNWGMIDFRNTRYLAPSYDHGSSLGRNESDEKRAGILSLKDRSSSIERYVNNAKSGFYPDSLPGVKQKSLHTIDAFQLLWQTRPEAGRVWLERLDAVSPWSVKDTIANVPDEIMSPMAKEFTERLLKANRDRLLALRN